MRVCVKVCVCVSERDRGTLGVVSRWSSGVGDNSRHCVTEGSNYTVLANIGHTHAHTHTQKHTHTHMQSGPSM